MELPSDTHVLDVPAARAQMGSDVSPIQLCLTHSLLYSSDSNEPSYGECCLRFASGFPNLQAFQSYFLSLHLRGCQEEQLEYLE